MAPTTKAPQEVDTFVCLNCKQTNPPVAITTEQGKRVCFSCGTPAPAEVLTEESNPLTGHDRCDSCQAQAFGRVTLREGGVLLFCGHHLARNFDALVMAAAKIEDFRAAINEKP